ncbi:MAG: prolipoprotein diacylglyceryl transferase [Bacteroidota bacterium]
MLSFILWDTAPEILAAFSDEPAFGVRWYGLFFASAFLVGQFIMAHILKTEKQPARELDAISVYMVAAVVIGARLGHCLFYEPGYFLSHPIEILKVWKGGLASHGATAGILFGIWLYARNRNKSYLGTLDRLVITIALGGALIRFGNLMNSEIIGKPADAPQTFVFARSAHDVVKENFGTQVKLSGISRTGKDTLVKGIHYPKLRMDFTFAPGIINHAAVDNFLKSNLPDAMRGYSETNDNYRFFDAVPQTVISEQNKVITAALFVYGVPRHPAQLYEALTCIVLFLLLLYLWNRWRENTPPGSLFGIFVIWVFTLRFFYEFLKENQVEFENNLPLNMGQYLSIPLILAGIIVTWMAFTGRTQKQVSTKN